MPDSSRDPAVQALLDRTEISDLVYRYAMGASEGDTAMLLSIFSPDIRLDYYKGSPGHKEIHGIEAVTAYFQESPATSEKNPMGFDRHFSSSPLIANIMIDLHGDEAHAESRGLVVHHGERGGRELFVMRSLSYSDDVVRLEEGWRIRVRSHPHAVWMMELDNKDPRGILPVP